MWLLGMAAALAAEPVVEVGADSWVTASIRVQAPYSAVVSVISDPEKVAAIDGGAKTTTQPDGECLRVHTFVAHPIASMDYISRMCPDGESAWHHKLVESEKMAEYESRWEVIDLGAETEIRYRLRTVTHLAVPQWMVNSSSKSAVRKALARLRDHLEGVASN